MPGTDRHARREKKLDDLASELVECGEQSPKGGRSPKARSSKPDDAKRSQATILIELSARLDYKHDADGAVYALLEQDGHREVWPVRSRTFKEWLSKTFYIREGKGCNNNSIADALNTIEARAKHVGKPVPIYLRVAHLEDRVYIDLCDDQWRVVEVTADGWSILDRSPVHFMRRNGMAALPIPVKGKVDRLRDFLNIDRGDFPLVVAWLVAALGGAKPYPALILQGEQGTGKSTTSRVIRSLCDPSAVPLRSPPREVRDLLVSAANNHVVVLDNLSGLNPEISDCLCRLSTGGGIDARQLYTDMEQVLVEIQRPVIVNGIDDIATRPDLAERSIVLNLPLIPASARSDEKRFWRDFESARPGIFGALLDGVSAAIHDHEKVILPSKPRMADFAIWSVAAEGAFGWRNEFMAAYTRNQDEAVEAGIEASPVGATLLELLGASGGMWVGNPAALLRDLECRAGSMAKSKAWPQSTKGLSNALKRLAPSLRRIGVMVDHGRGHGRFYRITQSRIQAAQATHPTHPANFVASSAPDSAPDRDDAPDTSGAAPHAPDTSGAPKAMNDAGFGGFASDASDKNPPCVNGRWIKPSWRLLKGSPKHNPADDSEAF